MPSIQLRHLEVIQYLQPLREGGSLPAIVKGNDNQLYVLKFRGAGQGKKALVAELIGGELARACGLRVPELVLMDLDNTFAKTEPDEEIQDLLNFSVGLNLGLGFLSGAITYDPLVSEVTGAEAAEIVLLDSILINIDRTARNTNLLHWQSDLWLIDHGACLYFHHNWPNWERYLGRPFPNIKDHVLLPRATDLPAAARRLGTQLSASVIEDIVASIPDEWLEEESDTLSPATKRAAYRQFLTAQLDRIDELAKAAADVQ